MDEAVHAIFLDEFRAAAAAVLLKPCPQVVGDADVKRSVFSAGEIRSPDGAQRNPGSVYPHVREPRIVPSGAHLRDPLAPSGLRPLRSWLCMISDEI
jgi:hypothetical protein